VVDAAVGVLVVPTAGTAAIATLGDSINAGGQPDALEGTAISYAPLVSEYLGATTWNPSAPSAKMGDIAVWQGGLVLHFAVHCDVIPADTSRFAITLASAGAAESTGSATPAEPSHFIGAGDRYRARCPVRWNNRIAERRTAAAGSKPVPASGLVFRSAGSRRQAIMVSFVVETAQT
jgi:hypothetical protein